MDFWIRPSSNVVSIDDAAISGIDCSSISPNVQLVRWSSTAQSGQVIYNDRVAVREPFTDPTPYLPALNNWLLAAAGQLPPNPVLGAATTPHSPTSVTTPTQPSTSTAYPPLSVAQAKAVKNNLIDGLFGSKRQAPITFMGNQYDASDAETSAMSNAIAASAATSAGQTLTNALGTLVGNTGTAGSINKALNDQNVSTNSAITSTATSANTAVQGHVTSTNTALANVASDIGGGDSFLTGTFNTAISTFNSSQATNETAAETNVDTNIVAVVNGAAAFPIGPCSNVTLFYTTLGQGSSTTPSTRSTSASTVTAGTATASSVTAPTVTTAGPSINWTPIGGTPAALSFSDFSALLKSITDRRATLQSNRATLKNSLNAMTTVAAVAAQDITAGW